MSRARGQGWPRYRSARTAVNRLHKRYVVRLELEGRERLPRLESVGKGSAAKLTHARVLLQADQSPTGPGWSDSRIAEGLGVASRAVENIRQRFVERSCKRPWCTSSSDGRLGRPA